MSVKYRVAHSKLGGQERAYPRLVTGKALTPKKFQRRVAEKAGLEESQVAAVLDAARAVLLEELREQQTVKMPELGTFSVSLKGDLNEGEQLVADSAKLKINFRPERSLMESFEKDLNYERVD